MFKSLNIKRVIVPGFLYLILIGCTSYTPYRYNFSLLESQNETMDFEDEKVQFKFVPSADSIRAVIKNKTDREIFLIIDKAEYINPVGESRMIHYGHDYVEEVMDFAREDKWRAAPFRIDPGTEVNGYVWINNWPDFHIGQGPGNTPVSSPNIINRQEPFLPRLGFEGSVQDLKDSTFNLILPIDFGEYVRDYTFTFIINDVV